MANRTVPCSGCRLMHDWPDSLSSSPARALADEVRRSGRVSMTAGELAERFGVRQLTAATRQRITDDLREANLICSPAITDAQRAQSLTVASLARLSAPASTP